jgi:arabinogalactan oligomer/maltooligosaccharide transport system substrate-binding protein
MVSLREMADAAFSRLGQAVLGTLERRNALAAALLFALLAVPACQDVGQRRIHLTVGTYWGGTAAQTLHRELIGIAHGLGSVDIDLRPFSYSGLEDYLSKNQPRGGQETLDIAVVPSDWLGELAQRGIIGEVPAPRVDEMRRTLVGQSLLAVSDGGRVLGFPIGADVLALIYDPSVFPSSPRTIDDVLSVRLPKGVLPFGLDLADPAQLVPFVTALQGSLLDRDGNLRWRDQEVLAAVRRLAPAWQAPERWAACRGLDLESLQVQLFTEGKLASFIGGPWLVHALEDGGRPFRVIPIPGPVGAPHPARSLVTYQCVVITRESPWADLALEAASRLLEKGANQRITYATRSLSVLLSAYESEQGAATGGSFGFLHALEEGQFLPPTAHWSEGFARTRARLARMTNLPAPPTIAELDALLGGEQP